MTATNGVGPQEAFAAASGAPATADQPHPDAERQRQLLQALTTEHFTLQTARAATINDSNGRSALYLSTVSSAVVALAFIGQVAHLGQAFFLFAWRCCPPWCCWASSPTCGWCRPPSRTCSTPGQSTASAATT